MALGEIRIHSPILARRVTVTFWMPDPREAGGRRYPGLLQLHGAYDDHSSWSTRSKLTVHLEKAPLITIMPDGALSNWSNWSNKAKDQAYEDFVIQDLLPACEYYFPIQAGRWAIGGLSMGGYGALRLGLKYPDRFASIWGHSSVVVTADALREWRPDLPAEDLTDADVHVHARRAVDRPDRPRLSFDCGVGDSPGLLEENRTFHRYLESIGYPHHYAEHDGGHDWFYWDEHVPEALRQHREVLAPEAVGVASSPDTESEE